MSHALFRWVSVHLVLFSCVSAGCDNDAAGPYAIQQREAEPALPEPLVEFVEDGDAYVIEHAVDLHWPAVPGPDASAYASDGVAQLRIENTSNRSIAPEILALGDMGGMTTARVDMPVVNVAAGEVVEIEIDVRKLFSFDTSKQKYSGQIKLCAFFKNEQTRTPPKCSAAIYFHPEGDGLKLYGENLLIGPYNGGDYQGLLGDMAKESGVITTRIYDGGLK